MLPYDEISKAITVRHLMAPIGSAVAVSASDASGATAEHLTRLHFDQAPVLEDGRVIGLVKTSELLSADPDSSVLVHSLASSYLVNAEAPVSEVLGRLLSVPMLFVVDETGLTGFVTPSDLNKHPARTHFYLLLADLEMTMAEEARAHFPGPDGALKCLSEERRPIVLARHAANQSFNVDADVLTAFEFADLFVTMQKTSLHNKFGVDSPTSWRATGWQLVEFRNDVMHPTREFLGRRTVRELLETEGKLRRMLLASSAARSS